MNSTNSGKCPKARTPRSERRKRTNFTKEQVDRLTKAFEEQPYPCYADRESLADEIGIPEARIHVWFQNRRARQPRPLKPGEIGESSQQDSPSEPQLPPDSLGYPSLPAGSVWGDPHGGNWSFRAQPQTFQPLEGSQEAFPSTMHAPAPVGPAPPVLQSSWDASAPSGSGLVPAVPQLTQQPPLLQHSLENYSHLPYLPQEPPQLPGDPFYAPQSYSSPDPALGLHGDSDLEEALGFLAQGSAPDGELQPPAFYGNEAVNWENWR